LSKFLVRGVDPAIEHYPLRAHVEEEVAESAQWQRRLIKSLKRVKEVLRTSYNVGAERQRGRKGS
jgi:hypothetical protein